MTERDRLAAIKALAEQLGLEGLAQIEVAAVRHRAVPPRLLRRLAEPDPLSPRERQVLVLLASGYSRPEIAEELGVTAHTVKSHLKRAYLKLGARNQIEAINAFVEWEA